MLHVYWNVDAENALQILIPANIDYLKKGKQAATITRYFYKILIQRSRSRLIT